MSREVKNYSKGSLFDTLIYLFIKIKRDDIFALASQLAYYLVLSFFPFLIFLITLVGFSNLDSSEVLDGLSKIVPTSVYELTSSTIVEVVDYQHTGLLGMSVILMIWSASSAFRAVIKGMNKAYEVTEKRSFIKISIIGMVSVLALALTIICTLTMLVFGDQIGYYISHWLPFEHILNFIWNIMRYVIIVVIMVFVFAMIYKVAPSRRVGLRSTIPGAIVATIGWIISSLAFSYYVNNFANYSRIYGSLGTMFALMTWLFITSMIFIFGGEVNSVLERNKDRAAKW